jgi:hypothetical protein
MLPYSALMTADSATLPSARKKLAARWVGRSRSRPSTLPSASARARGQPTAGRSRRGTLPFHQLVTLGYRYRGLPFLVHRGSEDDCGRGRHSRDSARRARSGRTSAFVAMRSRRGVAAGRIESSPKDSCGSAASGSRKQSPQDARFPRRTGAHCRSRDTRCATGAGAVAPARRRCLRCSISAAPGATEAPSRFRSGGLQALSYL